LIGKRIDLIDQIATELRDKYTFSDIDVFLGAFGIDNRVNKDAYPYKKPYVKDAIYDLSIDKLNQISNELGIVIPEAVIAPPKNWKEVNSIKAFISHVSSHKDKAKKLRDELNKLNFNCFVAHEDITPTLKWQAELEKALNSMEIFISLHTDGFSDSIWCQQEVGFAIAKKVKIIPIKFDEDPKGFINTIQALPRRKLNAEGVAKKIIETIRDDEDPKVQSLYNEKLKEVVEADSYVPF